MAAAASSAAHKEGSGYIAMSRGQDIWLFDSLTSEKVGELINNGPSVERMCMDTYDTRLACTVRNGDGRDYVPPNGNARGNYCRKQQHLINIWNLSSRELALTINSQEFGPSINLSKDGTKLIAAHFIEPKVYVYDACTGTQLLSLTTDPGTVLPTCVVFTPDDTHFLVGYDNALCSLFDTSSGNKIMGFGDEKPGTSVVRMLCSSHCGMCFILAGGIHAYDMLSGQHLWSNDANIYELCFDLDCRGIFVSNSGPTVWRIDIADGKETMELEIGRGVKLHAFNHATNSLIVTKKDRIVSVEVVNHDITLISELSWSGTCRVCCSSPPTMVLL
jgi:WD40 repeat protein